MEVYKHAVVVFRIAYTYSVAAALVVCDSKEQCTALYADVLAIFRINNMGAGSCLYPMPMVCRSSGISERGFPVMRAVPGIADENSLEFCGYSIILGYVGIFHYFKNGPECLSQKCLTRRMSMPIRLRAV